MSKVLKVTKGLDIKLKGEAEKVSKDVTSEVYAVKPTDFHGIFPKLIHKEGAEVKAGTLIMYDKYNEHAKVAAPVSGEIIEIVRGEKRKMLEIKILADKEIKYEKHTPKEGSREEIIESMSNGGLWPCLVERPYGTIANPEVTPKSIHISAFNSCPLEADVDYALHGRDQDFQKGIEVLAKLPSGKVHLHVHAEKNTSELFKNISGVEKHTFSGPHPSGLPGTQINMTDPINKGEHVWTVKAMHVAMIGKFFNEGIYDAGLVLAVGGSQIEKPAYFKTIMGASIKPMVEGNLKGKEEKTRFISGNVLTGDRIQKSGYIGFYHDTITAIPEGDEPQFLGWLAPNLDKFSLSRTFFSWAMPGKRYDLNTNNNGEERAFVVTGQYEQVFPLDIMPQQLIKSMMVDDIEKMEQLGIYEVLPEDFALCEYVCTSKQPLQEIVRKSLDGAKQELG